MSTSKMDFADIGWLFFLFSCFAGISICLLGLSYDIGSLNASPADLCGRFCGEEFDVSQDDQGFQCTCLGSPT